MSTGNITNYFLGVVMLDIIIMLLICRTAKSKATWWMKLPTQMSYSIALTSFSVKLADLNLSC